jgi:hypothetical protein
MPINTYTNTHTETAIRECPSGLYDQVSEWEWARKRLVGNGARGSQPYVQWWGMFQSSLAISKRAVNEVV